MPLNEILRTMPGGRGVSNSTSGVALGVTLSMALVCVSGDTPGCAAGCGLRVRGPLSMEIGPVTFFMTRLEKEIFSKRDPGLHRILRKKISENSSCFSAIIVHFARHLLDSLALPRHGKSSSELGSVMI